MNVLFYIMGRFYQVRANRARAAVVRLEVRAERFFQRIKGVGQ